MTLLKTKEFDQQFNRDLHFITINSRLPLWQKGSFKTKEWGDIVTDIDMTARVYFTPKLIDIVSNVLRKNRGGRSPFTFIHMAVGRYDGYDVPWTIDNNGGCDYEPQRTKVWFDTFKNSGLVPPYVMSYIQSKLFTDNMRISNLIDIENALNPYAEIVWTENDISKGFVQRGDKRYYLLNAMKTETPVLEYVYHYRGNEYVAIDVGLVDKKFTVPITDKMYRYYMDDWYKIMKTFRWKLPKSYKEAYFQTMNEITQLIALKYKIGLVEKLTKSNVLPPQQINALLDSTYVELDLLGINHKGIQLSVIANYLYEEVNKKLADSVQIYADKLVGSEQKKVFDRLSRGAQAQIPATQEQLATRRRTGIQCPFFATELDEYEQLTILAIHMDMDVELVVNCFSQVSIQLGKSVSQVIKDVVQPNDFSILVDGDEVILREHGQEKGRYSIRDKSKLQAYVLLKRKLITSV
jgi:hypothetical protein